ncbi:MAG: nitroreductase [Oscillospiraceae bacterium]|nr:nitroreductase [Oscillospiraceae bacterium]
MAINSSMQEAMKTRHTVRKYEKTELSAEIVKKLNLRIEENNQKYDLNIQLVTDNKEAMPGIMAATMSKNVLNYMILAGPDKASTEEMLGYVSADLMLYAQTLGLNTWWIGGMYSKKNARKNSNSPENSKIIGVVAVGYGMEQGVPHKSKSASDVSSYEGSAPEWFKAGVEAALLAPTGMNRQEFRIKGIGNEVSMTVPEGSFSKADLGISKYFFELGAGKENFTWK